MNWVRAANIIVLSAVGVLALWELLGCAMKLEAACRGISHIVF